jgi:hypothetical protein
LDYIKIPASLNSAAQFVLSHWQTGVNSLTLKSLFLLAFIPYCTVNDLFMSCVQLLHNAGYAPRLYATFCNGLAYEYVPGEILSTASCKDPDVFPLVARMMALMHRVHAGDHVPKEPSIWLKIQQFLDIMPRRFEDAEKQARYHFSLGHSFIHLFNIP